MTTSLTVSLFIVPSDPVNLLTHMQLCSSEIPFDKAEWEKVWIWLSAHLQPFFWPIGRILTIFDKKYRILRVLFIDTARTPKPTLQYHAIPTVRYNTTVMITLSRGSD